MTSQLPSLSLLDEGALPVAELARIAMREGVRPRDVYQAHKWFARRLAITARALLVGAACDRSHCFWRAFYKGDAWLGRTVLDPFMGGGVMLLEAMRLGASVRGIDIEPVAAAVARFQTTLHNLPDLTEALETLTTTVGRELAPYYRAQDANKRAETLLHAFWVQTIRCNDCDREFDAHPNFQMAWSDAERRQWIACSECSAIIEADLDAASVSCACGAETPTSGGRIERGKVCCPGCNRREALIAYARRATGPPRFRLFAVETLPEGDERRAKVCERRLRSATAFDEDCYRDAGRRLEELLAERPAALPPGPIPRAGRADNRLIDYGYSDYVEMFNARQRLHLAMIGAAIDKLKGDARHGLAIAFSDHLTTNNMFCGYAGGWRRLTPLFSVRAFRHIARPVEINPWLRKNGRGTFPNAVRAVARASKAMRAPKEPTPTGALKRIKDSPMGKADIVCGDARRMRHIPTASVDLVLTDPPYFDYISYSELGHFFTPWLRRFGLISRRGTWNFPKGQLASAARSRSAERRFACKLAEAFREIRRVCKPEARVVFTFQNLDGRGWNALAKAMSRAGVKPICALPLYGDSSASLHKHSRSISWDAAMVCRVSVPGLKLKVDVQAQAEGRRAAEAWSRALLTKKLRMTDGDRANIAHATTIVAAFERASMNHNQDQKRAAIYGTPRTPVEQSTMDCRLQSFGVTEEYGPLYEERAGTPGVGRDRL
jgi:putative DNA methylase